MDLTRPLLLFFFTFLFFSLSHQHILLDAYCILSKRMDLELMTPRRKYKALYLHPETFQRVQKLRADLKTGSKAVFGNDVIVHLLAISDQFSELEEKYLQALNRIQALQTEIINASLTQRSPKSSSVKLSPPPYAPPPSSPLGSNEKISCSPPVITQIDGEHPRNAMNQEIQFLMQGKCIKPSEILMKSRPKFAET